MLPGILGGFGQKVVGRSPRASLPKNAKKVPGGNGKCLREGPKVPRERIRFQIKLRKVPENSALVKSNMEELPDILSNLLLRQHAPFPSWTMVSCHDPMYSIGTLSPLHPIR